MMTELILNREQSRLVDTLAIALYGMTGLVLMENAGRNAAAAIARLRTNEMRPATLPVTICCGKGNNGGDGFVVARHLDAARIPVQVLLFCDPAKLTGDAAANYEIIRRAEVPCEVINPDFGPEELAESLQQLSNSSIVVDALLGTGARGEPLPPLSQVIDTFNQAPCLKVALDLPSGLDCDSGEPATHTIRADYTLTFVARKPGFVLPAAQPYVGRVEVLDIGVPRKLLDELSGETK